MIEIKDKNGKSLFKTEIDPKDLEFSFIGDLQKITTFKIIPKYRDNVQITLNETLQEILYKYWWGDE